MALCKAMAQKKSTSRVDSAVRTGLGPVTSGVTGRHSNQLN